MSLKKISYFFEKTATTFKRGVRFLTDDKPTEETFRNLLDSVVFKTEIAHRAKEDTGEFDPTVAGWGVAATDDQVAAKEGPFTDRTLFVQPHQIPSNVVDFALTLEELDVPSDAEIICIYDTSSFTTATSRVPAEDLITSWYNTYRVANPNFLGRLVEIEDPDERYLNYFLNYEKGATGYPNACRITTSAGVVTGGSAAPSGEEIGNTIPITTYKNKFVIIAFIDEAGYGGVEKYHTIVKANTGEAATTTFKNDYAAFLLAKENVEFFRGIIYPARGEKLDEENGTFHAHLTKTLTKGTLLSPPTLTAAQTANSWTTEMDFMTTSNPYTADGVDGLGELGWSSTQGSLTTPQIDSITQGEFDGQVTTELEADAGAKVIKINGKITMSDATEFDSSVEFSVPKV